MRTRTLIATRRCNQRCRFCDRVDPHATQATDPPLAELARAIEAGAAEPLGRVVISGGESTLRGDLVSLVALARCRGASHVALDTNATRIGPALAAALRQAGLGEVTVSFLGASHETCASIAGPAADPRLVLRGMKACLDAGLVVRVRLPIATGLPPAAARIEGLSRALPGVGPFVLAPIGAGESTLAPLSPVAELGAGHHLQHGAVGVELLGRRVGLDGAAQ